MRLLVTLNNPLPITTRKSVTRQLLAVIVIELVGWRNFRLCETVALISIMGMIINGSQHSLLSFACPKERSKEKGSRFRCGNCPKLIISPAEIGVEQMNLIEHFLSSALQNAVNDLG